MKFENVSVYNINNAIRGMRNPMNSWGKSDTKTDTNNGLEIGEEDMKLARRLIGAGSEHRKFLRQIFVSVDITAPRYWWIEADTYKVGVTSNSCSTMHKLTSEPITIEMFNCVGTTEDDTEYWKGVIEHLEKLRIEYNRTKSNVVWKSLICALPQSFIQKRTVTMNYENVLNMVRQRRNHKLTEWSVEFMEFVSKLPYAKEFFGV